MCTQPSAVHPLYSILRLLIAHSIIVKFADDKVVLGFITNNDETAYIEEVENLASWYQDNCLQLNISKTKELVVGFSRRHQRDYKSLNISRTPVPGHPHLRGPVMA